jgi:hypothetical protein
MRDAATVERWAIRIIVPLALVIATLAAVLLPHSKPLPAIALGSRWILYAVRALALFYGFLLVFVPLVRALRGVLPIELSLRGARWQEANEAATQAFEALDDRVEAMEQRVEELSELMAGALSRIAAMESGISPAVIHGTPPTGGS